MHYQMQRQEFEEILIPNM